jgi:hypothetical protein
MHSLRTRINGIPQFGYSGYYDKDDVFRKANEMWAQRHCMFPSLGLSSTEGMIEFEIVCDDGSVWAHEKILEEIQRRPELRRPLRVY